MADIKYPFYVVLERNGKVVASKSDYENAHWMLSGALGWKDDEATRIIEECRTNGKRLIFSYEKSCEDQSTWKWLGVIEDGMVYIG